MWANPIFLNLTASKILLWKKSLMPLLWKKGLYFSYLSSLIIKGKFGENFLNYALDRIIKSFPPQIGDAATSNLSVLKKSRCLHSVFLCFTIHSIHALLQPAGCPAITNITVFSGHQ